ncbi:hypothetical protein B0H67DRAFT_490888 [Lasiosphaeris hirsuta]|uniref:Protein kinase domain-containing protein n=1 Tax=Lasiosphaeris hirsuta TaxID=260670 RepID=A0AA40DVI8_9PEZI|nr:hypothetical protein B0H67DRAFT_490888 [Lasiosphaeris hirsuta]
MAEINDNTAEFAKCYERSREYPLTVLRTEVFGHTQKSLQTRLNQEGLFHSSHKSLFVRDLHESATEFDRGRPLKSVEDIETLLDPEEKDPWWRFIFLHSKTSRDALGCSKEQLALILTYHQVMPSFLDLVFTFKARQRPLTHALFRHENYLDENTPSLRLTHLGRSGIQIQHAFNLLTVERTDLPEERNQWPLRHASLYHSLDLETGRAVYILLKGNSELARRIKDATETNRHMRGDTRRTPVQSFVASLQVHLIMLEWAVEYWSEYIDSMDEALRTSSVEAKVAPVASVTSPIDLADSFHRRGSSFSKRGNSRALSRQGTMQTVMSRPGTVSRNSQPDILPEESSEPSTPRTPVTPTRSSSRSFSGFLRRASGGLDSRSTFVQGKDDIVEEPNVLIDQLADLEERFSFNELQRLSLTGDEIDRSILALEQSKDVVAQVEEQYRTVVSSHAFETLIGQEKCKTDVAVFFRRVRSILRDLDVHRRRLLDLSRTVANDKNMFESLSQHTSIQTSKAFQLVAQTSSDEMMKWTHKMHEIAVKTKQETLSMHVITIFTLIFLPGTFIATFFSSGVLNWDDDGTLGADYLVRGQAIRLFLSICLPMMAITIACWAVAYGVARRWARRHARDLGLEGYADERGLAPPPEPVPNGGEKSSTGLGIIVNPEPFRKFAEFVADIKANHIGRDLAGNSKNYVPLSALQTYWTPGRISHVLHAFSERLDIDVGAIKRKYLRIFSTLVYTNHDAVRNLQPLFISRNLSDESLPWRDRPSAWPNEKFFSDFFKQITVNQWQFFPLHFRSDQLQDLYVDDECILPIDTPVTIAQSNTTEVQHFDIHDGFNHLDLDEGRPTKKTFVFKVYHGKKHEECYENELRALRRLSVHPSPNVVKFYGSFRQLGSYCLMLEYVDGGNLGEFFASPAPSTVDDVVLFWKNIFQVFSGLDRIHQLMSYNDDEVIKGIHQDIRPENILLMKGPSGSLYDFTPKIADFGLYSRVRTARRASGSMGLDRYGNQRFSSPECCHHTIQRHRGTNMITTSADIFSMGAVLSHTAAWVTGGSKEQLAYFKSRTAYHSTKVLRFQNSGYEGCFHDSIEPLPVVKNQHRRFRECCRASNDDVTPQVLNWVEECMLVPTPKDRSRARVILEKFEQFIDNRCRSSPVTEIPTSPSEVPSALFSPAPVSTPSTPRTSANTPSTGIAPPGTQKQPDDSGSTNDDSTSVQSSANTNGSSASQPQQAGASQSTSAAPTPVPTSGLRISDIQFQSDFGGSKPVGQATADLVGYLEDNLGGRDQFFFIDDSRTMLSDKNTISEGFRALACIAKRLDPNQVELAFASRPRKVHRARWTKKLEKLVKGCEYRGEGHMMEARIGELIDNIITHLPYRVFGVNVNIFARSQVSVYVFTDGDWGDNSGDACGVEKPVRRLIDELKRRRLDRTQVSLHFVRFGDKENGKENLERLDECGREHDMDIVDVKHISTAVVGIMVGPITRTNDDTPG